MYLLKFRLRIVYYNLHSHIKLVCFNTNNRDTRKSDALGVYTESYAYEGDVTQVTFHSCTSVAFSALSPDNNFLSFRDVSNVLFQVKFHPERRDILVSGSTDGLVCLFDISKPSEDEALYGTLNSESSVVGSLIDYIKHTKFNAHFKTL